VTQKYVEENKEMLNRELSLQRLKRTSIQGGTPNDGLEKSIAQMKLGE
jgi:hypothetical protein